MIDYDKLLNLFVTSDDFRIALTKPFIQKGHYCATDAHSAIIIPVDKVDKIIVNNDYKTPDLFAVIPVESNCEKGTIHINCTLNDKESFEELGIQSRIEDRMEPYTHTEMLNDVFSNFGKIFSPDEDKKDSKEHAHIPRCHTCSKVFKHIRSDVYERDCKCKINQSYDRI